MNNKKTFLIILLLINSNLSSINKPDLKFSALISGLLSVPVTTNIALGYKKIKTAEKLKNCKLEDVTFFAQNYFDSIYCPYEREYVAHKMSEYKDNPLELKTFLQNIFDADAINGKRIIKETSLFGSYVFTVFIIAQCLF